MVVKSSLQTILVIAVAIVFIFFTFKQEGGEWEEMELRRNCPNLVTSSVSLLFPPSQESLQLALVHMAWPV